MSVYPFIEAEKAQQHPSTDGRDAIGSAGEWW